jgi:hypothetical protein
LCWLNLKQAIVLRGLGHPEGTSKQLVLPYRKPALKIMMLAIYVLRLRLPLWRVCWAIAESGHGGPWLLCYHYQAGSKLKPKETCALTMLWLRALWRLWAIGRWVLNNTAESRPGVLWLPKDANSNWKWAGAGAFCAYWRHVNLASGRVYGHWPSIRHWP